MTKLRPLGDKIVVRPSQKEERSPGGVILPDAAQKRPQEGAVLAVGPGRILDNGLRNPIPFRSGEKVLYSKYGGSEIKVDGEDLLIIDEDSIYAVIDVQHAG